jgi:hypothetical protein
LSIPDPVSSIRPGTVRRAALTTPCDIVVSDEADIISRLAEVDVLVTMALTAEIGCIAE